MAKRRTCELVRRTVEFAESLGFQVEFTSKSHLKFTKPGKRSVYASGTPGDKRASLNAMAQIRQSEAGIL